jgi:hypothetical protein
VGRLRGLDCDQPMQFVFRCGATRVSRCDASREDKCRPCSAKNRRNLIRRAEYGCELGGFVYLLTLTAPGDDPDHARLDPRMDGDWATAGHPKGRPAWRRPNAPRAICGCALPESPDGHSPLSHWNPTAAKRWNVMRTNWKRQLGGDLEYLRVVEVQDGKRRGDGVGRGALHYHFLIRTQVELDVLEVQKLALDAGFGCSVDLQLMAGSKAARYVAKYAAKGYTGRGDVPWYREVWDEGTGELVPSQIPTYRTVSQSQGWGLTKRQILAEVREIRRRAFEATQSVGVPTWFAQEQPSGTTAGVSDPPT